MKSFNNLPITAKLGILVGVTLLGLCAAGVMAARLVSQEMMSARMEQTHAIARDAYKSLHTAVVAYRKAHREVHEPPTPLQP